MSLTDSLTSQATAMLKGAAGSAQPAPAYAIKLDGKDISSNFNNRLLSLTLTDNRGFEADSLSIVLSDSDGLLAIPARGVTIELALGWAGQALIDKGSYIVDDVKHEGTPDKITLNGKSANLRAGLSTKKEKSWNGKTIADIVASIAAANDLTPKVSAALAGIVLEHVDQTNESDVNLLTRLAQDHDAIATVKKGMLLFMSAGEAQSATGIAFPTTTLTRSWGDSHSYSISAAEAVGAVQAYYQNIKGATQESITVDADGIHQGSAEDTATGTKTTTTKAASTTDAESESDSDSESDTDSTSTSTSTSKKTKTKTKVLRHTYANREAAERAARAEWQRLQRGAAKLGISAAIAHPELFPELPVSVSGFKPEIDAARWIITKCTHNLTGEKFTSTFEFELKPEALSG
jgi:uncharacterized protein